MALAPMISPRLAIGRVALYFWLVLVIVDLRCSSIGTSEDAGERKINSSLGNMENLIFRVHIDREQYYLGEDIPISYSLTNAGSSAVYVNARFAVNAEDTPLTTREVYLKVISPSKMKLPFLLMIEVGYPTRDCYVRLEPGATVGSKQAISLNRLYDIAEIGRYKVEGTYEDYSGPQLSHQNAWVGRTRAEPVEFQVIGKRKGRE